MGDLVAVEYVSLDGVMQAPGAPDEDPRGGFEHGGWATTRFAADPVAMQASMEGHSDTAALLFGRRTYDQLVGHWLNAPQPNPFADVLRKTPKYVASRTRAPLTHPHSFLLGENTLESVASLTKESAGDVVLLGSGMLVRDLAAAGLVDRYLLSILPVVLGTGTRLFGDTFAPMEVVSSTISPTGTVVATYRVVRERDIDGQR
ncbi:dihydrofolate reductase family protein [Planctomonas psychrotolerans]|uniref:dihydrofolate reductase family protein n=1 Tax=Planctomonas psychrotolerans TaxID=2528712 RepID=UPI00123B3418|nr:dihydrofolate reductase family protein [Planctomonas psychrotolerans]